MAEASDVAQTIRTISLQAGTGTLFLDRRLGAVLYEAAWWTYYGVRSGAWLLARLASRRWLSSDGCEWSALRGVPFRPPFMCCGFSLTDCLGYLVPGLEGSGWNSPGFATFVVAPVLRGCGVLLLKVTWASLFAGIASLNPCLLLAPLCCGWRSLARLICRKLALL